MTVSLFRSGKRRVPGIATIVIAVSCLPAVSEAQSKQTFPDRTPIACNFTWSLAPSDSPGDARDCGGYHFRLIRELGIQFNTLTISEPSWGNKELTYLVGQIPVTRPESGGEAPMVLVDRDGQLTRIVVIRRTDRINIAVGEVPFLAPPPGRLRPN